MSTINTSAPIPVEELKHFFADKTTFYQIDEKSSELQGMKLLTYLSNLDLPCDITLSDESTTLLQDYFNSPFIVSIDSLEKRAMEVLFQFKGIITGNDAEFIEANRDIIQHWVDRLDSLLLYNMYMVNEESAKEFVRSHPEDDIDSVVGVNFVSLLKHEAFYLYYAAEIDQSRLKYYSKYFNDPMFRGKSIFAYWGTVNNPMFLLTYGLAEGLIDPKTLEVKTLETK